MGAVVHAEPRAPSRTLLKVCGATSVADVDLLRRAGVGLTGLWHGVPDGHAELDLDSLIELAAACRAAATEAVLVTLDSDHRRLSHVLHRSGATWVQLHGYQLPAVVAALKRAVEGLTVVKVLHVRGSECVEAPLIPAYERAGTDLFLMDASDENGRIGSTAQALDTADVLTLAGRLSIPFLLAGGISAERRQLYDDVVAHRRFAGVDVDTAARDTTGALDAVRVGRLREAWGADQEVAVR